ncbi:MAG: MerR family transcriptional regulator [Frankia sp.]
MARESGLSVSALRFYDAAGVIRPARVDPATGYRWYDADQVVQARLIAALRRVRMPLDDIGDVLSARDDPVAAGRILDRHLRRLEQGLADARRHLGVARDLLDRREKTMTGFTTRGCDLAGALGAVRFATSSDPELPALNGVLFDYDARTLRIVASDRYRLAVATVATRDPDGPAVRTVVPRSLLDRLELPVDGDVRLGLDQDTVAIGAAHAPAVGAAFPDWERLPRTRSTHRITIAAADLRHRLTTGPTRTMTRTGDGTDHDVSMLHVTGDTIGILDHDHPDAIGFNREFLLEALDAGGADQLVLGLDGPVEPLAIHPADRADLFTLLMPVRLNPDRQPPR